MQWIGMGKVVVAVAGVPTKLSAVPVKVNSILFTFDPADATATVYVKDNNGNVIAPLATAGSAMPILISSQGGNALNLQNFEVDSSANGKGPFVGYGVN
jgi:hypothetical protein